MWSTGEENGKPLLHSCLENPMNSMKRQKDRPFRCDLSQIRYDYTVEVTNRLDLIDKVPENYGRRVMKLYMRH